MYQLRLPMPDSQQICSLPSECSPLTDLSQVAGHTEHRRTQLGYCRVLGSPLPLLLPLLCATAHWLQRELASQ